MELKIACFFLLVALLVVLGEYLRLKVANTELKEDNDDLQKFKELYFKEVSLHAITGLRIVELEDGIKKSYGVSVRVERPVFLCHFDAVQLSVLSASLNSLKATIKNHDDISFVSNLHLYINKLLSDPRPVSLRVSKASVKSEDEEE